MKRTVWKNLARSTTLAFLNKFRLSLDTLHTVNFSTMCLEDSGNISSTYFTFIIDLYYDINTKLSRPLMYECVQQLITVFNYGHCGHCLANACYVDKPHNGSIGLVLRLLVHILNNSIKCVSC